MRSRGFARSQVGDASTGTVPVTVLHDLHIEMAGPVRRLHLPGSGPGSGSKTGLAGLPGKNRAKATRCDRDNCRSEVQIPDSGRPRRSCVPRYRIRSAASIGGAGAHSPAAIWPLPESQEGRRQSRSRSRGNGLVEVHQLVDDHIVECLGRPRTVRQLKETVPEVEAGRSPSRVRWFPITPGFGPGAAGLDLDGGRSSAVPRGTACIDWPGRAAAAPT